MQFDLTKKEYRALLDMVTIADWIMNAHEESVSSPHVEHEALKNKLLSHYKEMKCEDRVGFDDKCNRALVIKEYEEHIIEKYIAPYEDIFFWDELSNRLAERDAINKIGLEQYLKMGNIERICAIGKFEESYTTEFVEYGIDHLNINHVT